MRVIRACMPLKQFNGYCCCCWYYCSCCWQLVGNGNGKDTQKDSKVEQRNRICGIWRKTSWREEQSYTISIPSRKINESSPNSTDTNLTKSGEKKTKRNYWWCRLTLFNFRGKDSNGNGGADSFSTSISVKIFYRNVEKNCISIFSSFFTYFVRATPTHRRHVFQLFPVSTCVIHSMSLFHSNFVLFSQFHVSAVKFLHGRRFELALTFSTPLKKMENSYAWCWWRRQKRKIESRQLTEFISIGSRSVSSTLRFTLRWGMPILCALSGDADQGVFRIHSRTR